jgi:phage/plasmid-like protein (TIGR03299 family)
MAHNLDINNGTASFVSARQDAWHRLGTVLPETFTAEQAMEFGNLGGWNVRKLPTYATAEDGCQVEMPGKYATVRTNPVTGTTDFLGAVGSMYSVIQNEEHAAFLDTVVDESGAHFETAGAINGGRTVFLTMKLPGTMLIGGVDPVNMYLAAMNSHDGSSPFTMMTTPVRVVCENTLNIALGETKSRVAFRHTSGASASIRQQARDALNLSFNYLDAFNVEAERLIQTALTQQRFEEIISKAFGAAEDAPKASITRADIKLDKMSELFADAQTQTGIRDTAWAGFNALTEWYDHFSEARGTDPEASRAINAVLYPEFKNKALALMLQG